MADMNVEIDCCIYRQLKFISIIIRYILMAKCEVCSREAYFSCSKCQKAYYCSKDHQIDDWKATHKKKCFKMKEENDDLYNALLKKRFFTRKQFYDNYSNKVFEHCLIDAKVMVDFDKKIKGITDDSYDEF